jgi:antitoxin HigA-1
MINGAFASFGGKAIVLTSKLSTTTRRVNMASKKLPPIHPGEILLEEYLIPMGISQYRLAKEISVSARRINEIVHGKRSITADTALRLARFFKTTELFWVNLQIRFDMEIEKDKLADRLDREVSVFSGTGSWDQA